MGSLYSELKTDERKAQVKAATEKFHEFLNYHAKANSEDDIRTWDNQYREPILTAYVSNFEYERDFLLVDVDPYGDEGGPATIHVVMSNPTTSEELTIDYMAMTFDTLTEQIYGWWGYPYNESMWKHEWEARRESDHKQTT